MSPQQRHPAAGEVVLVWGEHLHDSEAIKELVHGLRPDLRSRGIDVAVRRRPLTLVKGLSSNTARSRSAQVGTVIRAEMAVKRVRACIFHEDTDEPTPSHTAMISQIHMMYGSIGPVIVPAVAAWEIEAWWLLFPNAVKAVRPGTWTAPTAGVGRDTGRMTDPKAVLKRSVRPSGARVSSFRTYEEGDSPAIARFVVQLGCLAAPVGTNASWSAFITAVASI